MSIAEVQKIRQSAQSPGYGATGSSPRAPHRITSNPPPLDIGEAVVPSESSPPARDLDKARKGVTFPSDANRSSGFASSEDESRYQSSTEGPAMSDSAQPLTSPGPSKSRPSQRVGKSPRFTQSPQAIGSGSPRSPRNVMNTKIGSSLKNAASPQLGRRSIRRSNPRGMS